MKRYLKTVACFLTLLILIQSCTVYKSANVTLSEASESNKKVKITTDSGKKVKFNKIELSDDGKFYGFVSRTRKFWINTNQVEKVQLLDKKTSDMVNIGLGIGLTLLIWGFVSNNADSFIALD